LILCLSFVARAAPNSAVAQADGPAPAEKIARIGSLALGEAIVLDRVAFAVEGAESDYGADPQTWRSDLAGPQGPMQISASAAEDVGRGDRFDEKQNRALGRAYLAQLYRQYGNWPDAVAAYNWGPGHMNAWIGGGRPFDKLPASVERYRVRVLTSASRGMLRLGLVHRQPRGPVADPHGARAAVERLYPEIMRASAFAVR
jgi:hypothetical protein